MKSYIIKIEFEKSYPLIWRRLVLPAGATYNKLHDVIQNVTNFKSGYPNAACHLYEFELKKVNMIVTNSDDAYYDHQHYKRNPKYYEKRLKETDPEYLEYELQYQEELKVEVRKSTVLKIDEYLKKYKKIRYHYDFGDDWWLTIKLEKIVDDYYLGHPALLDGAEDAPPEDVGGIYSFYSFLDAFNDPEHPAHEEKRAWGEGPEFMAYDPEMINRRLQAISYKKTEWEKVKEFYLSQWGQSF